VRENKNFGDTMEQRSPRVPNFSRSLKMEKIIRLVFLTSVEVAGSETRPRFTP